MLLDILLRFCPIILSLTLITKNKSLVKDDLPSLPIYASAALPSSHSITAHDSGVLLSSLASTSFYHLYCLTIVVSHLSFILRELVILHPTHRHNNLHIYNFGVLKFLQVLKKINLHS